MNGRAVRYFIGHILRWEAILMLPALIIAIVDKTWGAVNGFLITMLALLVFSSLLLFIGQKRDHSMHKSPNAGHPESAAAGLLRVQIGGTNIYFGQVVEKPTIGDADTPLTADTVRQSLKIMTGSEMVFAVLATVVYIVAIFFQLR